MLPEDYASISISYKTNSKTKTRNKIKTKSKVRNASIANQKKFIINADGNIGIGFYDTPVGAIAGGLNGNLDILPFTFLGFNAGVSTGFLAIMKYSSEFSQNEYFSVPAGFKIMKMFHGKPSSAIPYICLTPSAYFVFGKGTGNTPFQIGIGGSAGAGLLIPIAKNLYIDLSMRFHYIFADSGEYPILSSNLGISLAL